MPPTKKDYAKQSLANTNYSNCLMLMNCSFLGYIFYLFLTMTIGKVTEAWIMGEPVSVAIGRMVNPASFWVHPLPNSDAPECIDQVLQLEAVGLS